MPELPKCTIATNDPITLGAIYLALLKAWDRTHYPEVGNLCDQIETYAKQHDIIGCFQTPDVNAKPIGGAVLAAMFHPPT